MRVCFYTLGCKVNLNETGALEQLFRANGFTIAQEGEAADVFIVNSCTVTNFGDQKSRKLVTVQLFTMNTSAASPSCAMVKPLARNSCSSAPVSFRLTLQPKV